MTFMLTCGSSKCHVKQSVMSKSVISNSVISNSVMALCNVELTVISTYCNIKLGEFAEYNNTLMIIICFLCTGSHMCQLLYYLQAVLSYNCM